MESPKDVFVHRDCPSYSAFELRSTIIRKYPMQQLMDNKSIPSSVAVQRDDAVVNSFVEVLPLKSELFLLFLPRLVLLLPRQCLSLVIQLSPEHRPLIVVA